MQACEEVSSGLLIACRNGSELLAEVEEPLDEIAFGIKREVARSWCFPVGFRRNDGSYAANLKAFDEPVGVIAFVGDESLGGDLRHEGLCLCDVVGLALGQAESQGIAQGIHDHMDLGGQTAARPAYGLVLTPFFRAPALCW